MLAYEPGVPVAYNITLTTLSLLTAAAITTGGLAVAVAMPRPWGALIGGSIIGGGVACMHYLGMFALELAGRVTWDLPLVAGIGGLGNGAGRGGAGHRHALAGIARPVDIGAPY